MDSATMRHRDQERQCRGARSERSSERDSSTALHKVASLRFRTAGARLEDGFVGGGAVETGNGNAEEAEVDRQLGAMVNDVVEAHGAERVVARQGEDGLAVVGQGPILTKLLVGDTLKRLVSILGGAIEGVDQHGVFFDAREASAGDVEARRADDGGAEAGQGCDVPGEPAE